MNVRDLIWDLRDFICRVHERSKLDAQKARCRSAHESLDDIVVALGSGTTCGTSAGPSDRDVREMRAATERAEENAELLEALGFLDESDPDYGRPADERARELVAAIHAIGDVPKKLPSVVRFGLSLATKARKFETEVTMLGGDPEKWMAWVDEEAPSYIAETMSIECGLDKAMEVAREMIKGGVVDPPEVRP